MTMKGRTIVKSLVIFLSLIVCGLLLVVISMLFPEKAIHRNVVESADVFIREGAFPRMVGEYEASITDNNTDAWMLLLADFHDDEMGVIDQALGGYFRFYSLTDTGLAGIDNISEIQNEQPYGVREYARYWHGWLFFLRLLLCFFSYDSIRILNLIILIVLLMAVLFGLWIKKQRGLIFPLLISVFILFPNVVSQCMAYMISFIISMTAILVILFAEGKLIKRCNMPVLFMIIGAVTAYSEFLQFPILTLGFPLVVYVYKLGTQKESAVERVKVVVVASTMWAMGYFGMWMSKWIITTLLTHHNILAEAFSQIKIRISSTQNLTMSEKISRWDAIIRCIWKMNIRPFLVALGVGGMFYFCAIAIHSFRYLKENLANGIPYLCVLLIPFAWAMVFANHTYMHSHYTYRIFAVSVLALYAWAAEFLLNQSRIE